jgi:hypothetical protein
MSAKNFEELAIKYPLLFQKAKITNLEINSGWLNIIDTLCAMISNHAENVQRGLVYEQGKSIRDHDRIARMEAEFTKLVEDLPAIAQVKEKFGGLRFYVYGGTEEHRNFIRFAEAMSFRTCEQCGAPGETRSTGWTKTLCDRHHREHDAKEAIYRAPRKFDATKLED